MTKTWKMILWAGTAKAGKIKRATVWKVWIVKRRKMRMRRGYWGREGRERGKCRRYE